MISVCKLGFMFSDLNPTPHSSLHTLASACATVLTGSPLVIFCISQHFAIYCPFFGIRVSNIYFGGLGWIANAHLGMLPFETETERTTIKVIVLMLFQQRCTIQSTFLGGRSLFNMPSLSSLTPPCLGLNSVFLLTQYACY